MASRILLVAAIAYGIRDASVLKAIQREAILFSDDIFAERGDEALLLALRRCLRRRIVGLLDSKTR